MFFLLLKPVLLRISWYLTKIFGLTRRVGELQLASIFFSLLMTLADVISHVSSMIVVAWWQQRDYATSDSAVLSRKKKQTRKTMYIFKPLLIADCKDCCCLMQSLVSTQTSIKWRKLWLPTDYFKRYFSVIGWCRAEWEVLETVIGQVDEPFQVTLLYTTCLGEDGSIVALDSLEFIDCEAGEFIMFQRAVLYSFLISVKPEQTLWELITVLDWIRLYRCT